MHYPMTRGLQSWIAFLLDLGSANAVMIRFKCTSHCPLVYQGNKRAEMPLNWRVPSRVAALSTVLVDPTFSFVKLGA